MMRMPKGVSPASARPAAGLSCSQHKVKLLSTGAVKTEFFSTGLSSPLMNTVPAGYFTQICNTTAAEQRANSLYSTPNGPEAKPIRSSSGRLPVKNQTHTANTMIQRYCLSPSFIRGVQVMSECASTLHCAYCKDEELWLLHGVCCCGWNVSDVCLLIFVKCVRG